MLNSPCMFSPRRHGKIPMEFEDFNISEKNAKISLVAWEDEGKT